MCARCVSDTCAVFSLRYACVSFGTVDQCWSIEERTHFYYHERMKYTVDIAIECCVHNQMEKQTRFKHVQQRSIYSFTIEMETGTNK